MSIKVECDECGKKYRIPDDRAGEWIECRECGADIDVPDDGWDGDDYDEPRRRQGGARSAGRRPSRQPANDGLSPGAKPAIIGGVFAITLIVVVVISLNGGGDERPRPDVNDDQRLARNDRPSSPPHVTPSGQPNTPNPSPQPGTRPGSRPTLPPQMKPPSETVTPPGPPRASDAVGWRVTVDPAPTPKVDPEAEPVATVDNSKPISITFPKDSRGSNTLLLPARPSGLVVLGENTTEARMREFWNVNTGKRVGVMTGLRFNPRKQAVSPGGAFYAATTFSSPGVLLWDVAEQKAMGELPLSEDGKRPSDMPLLALPTDELVVAVVHERPGGSKKVARINVWSLPSGDPLKSFETEGGMSDKVNVFSPGGRFIGFRGSEYDSGFFVYDLTTGQKAGQIFGPPHSPRVAKPRAEAQAAAFSNDGSQLAIAFRGTDYQVVVYDVASGKPSHHIPVDSSQTFGGPRDSQPIQWFPGGEKLLLFGNSIASLESESIIHTFPKPKSDPGDGVWITGENQLGARTGDYQNQAFTLVKVDDAAIADQQERMARGETAEDAGLPSLTNPIAGQAKIATVTPTGGWSLAADPSSGLSSTLLMRPAQIQPSSDILGNSGRLLVAGDAPRAVLHCGADRRSPATGATSLSSIDILDLTKGNRADTLPINFPCAALAISPDGTRVITRSTETPHRMDVWDLEGKKHVVGWRPKIAKWPTDNTLRFLNRGIERITSAAFVDSEHVLTVSNEAAVMWKIPECQDVYLIVQPRTTSLSPGRKYLVCGSSNKTVAAFDSLTGDPLGSLPVKGGLDAVAIHPSGDRMAISGFHNSSINLSIVDWKTGTVSNEFPIPNSPRQMRWVDDRYVLTAGGHLIDLTEKLVAWQYLLSVAPVAPISPDMRIWAALSGLRPGGPVALTALPLPDSAVKSRLSKIDLTAKMLMGPGSTVSVQAAVTAQPPGRSNFQASIVEKLTERLKFAGHSVQPNAPFRAVASLALRRTGETKSYVSTKDRSPIALIGRLPADAKETKVPVEELVFSVKLVDAGGKTIWEGPKSTVTNTSIGSFETKENESVTQFLSRNMWSRVDSMFGGVFFPGRVFDPASSSGFGRSTFVNGKPVIMNR
jgi:WD40 repeat protein